MTGEQGKNKGGRPRRSKDEGVLSRSLTFRVRPTLYDRVQKAAAAEHRSLSEEIEARLVQTFDRELIDQQRFGDPKVGFLTTLIASTVNLIQLRTGRSFVSDGETLEAVKAAITEIFDCCGSIFDGVSNVPLMQRRFDRLEFERLTSTVIDEAAHASIDLKDVIGR